MVHGPPSVKFGVVPDDPTVELENVVVSAPAGVLPDRMKAPLSKTKGASTAIPCLIRRIRFTTNLLSHLLGYRALTMRRARHSYGTS